MRHIDALALKRGSKVIDLGGTCEIWRFVRTPLNITIVNLPGVPVDNCPVGQHSFTFVEGDATELSAYRDNQFDAVFSNSVIEHVGGEDRQLAFSLEVRRLAPAYYVQTPSIWFPLEAHSGVPFWWALPKRVRDRVIRHWHARLPAWAEMIEGTTVIRRKRLQSYFPDGRIITERVMGIPKSYVVLRTARR